MKLVVRNGVAGRGVFTLEPIRSGQHILRFTGPFLRHAQTSPTTMALQVGEDLYIGASGGMDDIVNHSCEPNAGHFIVGSGIETRVDLVAIRDIAAGEEIFFDYSTTMDEDDFEMPCLCGRPTCRKVVRDFKYLPLDLRKRYADLGIVPVYNLKYVRETLNAER